MFKNARDGIGKIYISELMMLIASVITLIGTVVGMTTVQTSTTEASETDLAVLGVFVLVFAIVALIAFILNIVGLAKARKDEENFNKAFMLTFVGLAASIISSFFSNNKNLSDSFNVVIDLIWLLVTIFIIIGVVSLAKQTNHSAVAQKGENLLKVIIGVEILALVIKAVGVICAIAKTGQTVTVILSMIAGAVTVVYHIIYITLLGNAKKMLE